MNPRAVTLLIACIILLGMGAYALLSAGPSCFTAPASTLFVDKTTIRQDFQVKLRISINGDRIAIPALIGQEGSRVHPLHTIDQAGTIRIQSSCTRAWTLSDFFDVWNTTLTDECIFEHCTVNGELITAVNGQHLEPIREHVLKPGDIISISYRDY